MAIISERTVELVVDARPREAGAELADRLDATLVDGTDLAMAVALRLAEPPPGAVDQLQAIAAELGQLERIRVATETKVAERLAPTLPGSPSVVHPASLRAAASEVLVRRRRLDRVRRRLTDPHWVAAAALGEGASDEVAVRRLRRFAVAVAVAMAVMLVAAGAWEPVVLLAPVLAVVVAVAARRADEAAERRETRIAHPTGATAARVDLAAERRSVEAEVADAERAWNALAGTERDPAEVEEVVRQRDPHAIMADLVGYDPAARAVARLHRQVRARWRGAWAELGMIGPSVADGAQAIAELGRADQPVVVIESPDSTPDQRDLLDQLAARARVVVVSRPDADEPL